MSLITGGEDSIILDIMPPDIDKPAVTFTAIEKDSSWKPESDVVRIVKAKVMSEDAGSPALDLTSENMYQYHETGEGCRFWMKTISRDFEAAGFISAEKAEEVGSTIEYYWPDPATNMQRVIRPITAGNFLA